MSYKLVSTLIRDYTGPRHALPVLLAIADHADQHGVAWPSVPNLATRCKMSDRHIRRSISALIASGHLRLIGSRAGGRALSARYQVITNPDTGVRLSEEKPGHRRQGLTAETRTPMSVNPDTGVRKPGHPCPPKQSRIYQEPINSVEFEAFWAAYPKKRGKVAARKAWVKLNPDADTCRHIVRQVDAAARTHDWRKDGGQYIPLPATYLNGRRFDDELVVTAAADTLTVAL